MLSSFLNFVCKRFKKYNGIPIIRIIIPNSYVGPNCPKGMTSLYGKCVGIVKNSESNTGDQDNCKWKSGSSSFELAKFGNVKVIFQKFE